MAIRVQIARAIVALFAAGIGTLGTGAVEGVRAQSFEQQEIPAQNRLVAVAAPVGNGESHQLLIIEQLGDQRPCWSESGTAPTVINPLLLTFDFTGICGRALDSNAYSIRLANQELGLNYRLSVVRSGNDLLLIGRNPLRRSDPVVEIGRTNGLTNDFAKIYLNPGWRFTRRAYQGQALGHIYLTHDRSLAELAVNPPSTTPVPSPTPVPIPTPTPVPAPSFRDITSDIYRTEIEQAVQIGFVGGFLEDNTFRPLEALTREQLVSLVLEALQRMPSGAFPLPQRATANPYFDVQSDRWSAAKIQYARDIQIVSGYPDGTFRPAQPVTRAELIAVLRNAAIYGQLIQKQGSNLTPRQAAFNFVDTAGHWAQPTILEMSAYCQVASPVNERGTLFLPDAAAQRNYAAAATLRMLRCLGSTN